MGQILCVGSWNPSSRSVFAVKSYYKMLKPPVGLPFPWKSLQKPKVPTKVVVFLWIVALGRILTVDNLRKLWVIVIDWCCMCKMAGETTDHPIVHSHFNLSLVAWELWSMDLSLFGVHWVMPQVVDVGKAGLVVTVI